MNALKDPKTLAVILLLLVCFWYFRKGVKKPEEAPVEPRETALVTKKESVVEVSKEEVDSGSEAIVKAQKLRNRLMTDGVIQIPTQDLGDKLKFAVMPRPVGARCKPGDFDLMKVVPESYDEKIFTVSVESMEGDGYRTSMLYSIYDMQNNLPFSIQIPKKNGAYGLYLCIDSKNKKSCADAPTLDPKTWGQSDGKIRSMAKNRTIYFQMIEVVDETANIIPAHSWGANDVAKLETSLKDWMGKDVKYLPKMATILKAISPLPASIRGDKVSMPLRFMQGTCP